MSPLSFYKNRQSYLTVLLLSLFCGQAAAGVAVRAFDTLCSENGSEASRPAFSVNIPAGEQPTAESVKKATEKIERQIDVIQGAQEGQTELYCALLLEVESAAQMAAELQMHKELANFLVIESLVLFLNNNFEGREALLLEALKELESARVTEAEKGPIYGALSYHYIINGEFVTGIDYLRRKVVIDLESGQAEKLAIDFYMIGDAYLNMGETDVARRYFEQSLVPFEESRGRDYYDSLNKLGTIDRIQGDFSAAREKHLATRNFYRAMGGYRELPAAVELAKAELGLGNLGSARSLAESVVNDSRSMTEQRLDAALIVLELDLQEERTRQAAVWLALSRQLLTEAEAAAAKALIHPLRRIKLAELAVTYYQREGEPTAMMAAGDEGLNVYEKLRQSALESGVDLLAWAQKVEPFITRYVAALYQYQPQRISEVLELAYSDSLVAAPGGAWAKVSARPEDIVNLERYLSDERSIVDALADYQASSTPLNKQALEHARQLRDQSRERYLLSAANPAPPVYNAVYSPKADAFTVPEGDLALRYYIREEVSIVIIYGQSGTRVFDLPSKSKIQELLQSLEAEMLVVGSRRTNKLLKALAALIPADVLLDNSIRRLVLVPDDVVHAVPFSAIDIAGEGRQYTSLSGRFELVRTHSVASYFKHQLSPDRALADQKPQIFIFADPAFSEQASPNAAGAEFRNWSESLVRLPYTAKEAQSIARLYPAGTVSLHLGKQATSKSLLSDMARNSKVLHIATHGYFNDLTPDIVGIATAADFSSGKDESGFLSLTALLNSRFNSNLVVLSSCETMRGKGFNGPGFRSLTQGLVAQGAGAVIGTLWRIPDRATAEFMREFYTALLQTNGNASQALQRAKEQFTNSSKWSDPSYWAGFVLTSSAHASDRAVFQNP